MLIAPALFDLDARAHTRELFDNTAAPRAMLPRLLRRLHRACSAGPSFAGGQPSLTPGV